MLDPTTIQRTRAPTRPYLEAARAARGAAPTSMQGYVLFIQPSTQSSIQSAILYCFAACQRASGSPAQAACLPAHDTFPLGVSH